MSRARHDAKARSHLLCLAIYFQGLEGRSTEVRRTSPTRVLCCPRSTPVHVQEIGSAKTSAHKGCPEGQTSPHLSAGGVSLDPVKPPVVPIGNIVLPRSPRSRRLIDILDTRGVQPWRSSASVRSQSGKASFLSRYSIRASARLC